VKSAAGHSAEFHVNGSVVFLQTTTAAASLTKNNIIMSKNNKP